ncbi:phage virion morphogenesis protein [Novosphingobium mangrovi (ex Hu et al. 2023)]|uniref:Phage virion morphogenesis protein n=1 Tax=Novosphingobium mangrovi (ex Hu et al. 2023) TaxID=2930094 RepID=A0ABT0A8Y3_9SPHN|nr:phage virion morphogenesis protein [Novosphingobium mangrovi (ex Hu et al. 2023)]MCJ1959657.1 phage virion morphogenesis protein [Novosphingobium mangrovi (ex Hu et al. 2023)]
MAVEFAELEQFLEAYRERMNPAERRKASRKLGQEIRKLNAQRIARNVEPDGSPMQPRKPRMADGGRRIRAQRMFRKLRLAKSFKVMASEDGVSVGFIGNVGQTARAHHYGQTDFVGRTLDGKSVRARYPRRRLLGFGPDDLELINEAAMNLLDP